MARQQKPPDLDASGNPVSVAPPDLDANGNPVTASVSKPAPVTPALTKPADTTIFEIPTPYNPARPPTPPNQTPAVDRPQPGMLERAYSGVTSPLADLRGFTPEVKAATDDFAVKHPWVGGPINFALDTISGLSSPLNLATAGSFTGGGLLANRFPTVANALTKTGRALSYPVVAHGLGDVVAGEDLAQRASGLLEMGGGIAGIRTGRSPSVASTTANAAGPTGPTGPVTGHKKIFRDGVTPELVKEYMNKGYRPGGTTPDGFPFMIRDGLEPQIDRMTGFGKPRKPDSLFKEIYNAPRALMSVDLPYLTSAALRQALPLAGTKAWFQAWGKAASSYGDKAAYTAIMDSIAAKPLFKNDFEMNFKNGKWEKRNIPSKAEQAGLRMTDIKTFRNAKSEETISHFVERFPIYGTKHIAGSNRAYTAFLNHLRAEKFEQMVTGLKAEKNMPLMKEIAEFVNNATGRGTMKLEAGGSWNGKKYGKTISLEKGAEIFSALLFSPRNNASKINIMNPSSFLMAPKGVRKEYLLSGLRVATTWSAMSMLLKMAGGEVTYDMSNPDFMKARFGNTRIDSSGGYGPFIVLAAKLAQQQSTSSTNPQAGAREFGTGGINEQTAGSTMQNFSANKEHPTAKLLYDMAFANQKNPVFMGDRIAQLFLPMLTNDIAEVIAENPDLAPFVLGASTVGVGSQTYDGKSGMNKPAITPAIDKIFGTNITNNDWMIGRD
jgi:hypothetical protein